MRCGRNVHKVAIRHADRSVEGLCPSCFNGRTVKVLAPGTSLPYYDIPFTAWLGGEGATILYDRRARKPANEYPVVAPPPAPKPTDAEVVAEIPTVTLGGRRLWKWCLHPAELDINGNCYTCGERPR